jgi:hypothetical protein
VDQARRNGYYGRGIDDVLFLFFTQAYLHLCSQVADMLGVSVKETEYFSEIMGMGSVEIGRF